MYHHDKNQYSTLDVNLFVPELSVFEGVAEGVIQVCSRTVGFIRVVINGLVKFARCTG